MVTDDDDESSVVVGKSRQSALIQSRGSKLFDASWDDAGGAMVSPMHSGAASGLREC